MQTKISPSLSFLKYAKKVLRTKILNLIYKGLVEPHFRYCCSVWGNSGESTKNALQKLQNRAAGIAKNSSYNASASPLLSKLHWPSIDEIINGETISVAYKSRNSLAPIHLCSVITKNSSRDIITLRNFETDLHVPFMNTKRGQKMFSYRGAHLWNCLQPASKNAPSFFASKRAINQQKQNNFSLFQ